MRRVLGLKSAFVARFIATVTRAMILAPGSLHLGQLLGQVSATISKHAHFERVSMQTVALDPVEGVLDIASAGHPYPVLYSARYGRCDRLPVRGGLLHAQLGEDSDGRPYELRHVEIGDGDVLVLVSDGIIEPGPLANPYGYRFADVVVKSLGQSARSIAAAIIADWRQYLGGQPPADDAAVLVLVVGAQRARGRS